VSRTQSICSTPLTQPLVTELATLEAPITATASDEAELYNGAVLVARSDRRRWIMEGAKAAEILNGLVTNDITGLTAGTGCYAALLTAKGKVVADLRILARASDFLIETSASAGERLSEMLRKFVNPRLAKWRDVSEETRDVAIAGSAAATCVATMLGPDQSVVESLPPHGHIEIASDGSRFALVRSVEIDVPAFELIGTTDAVESARWQLTSRGVRSVDRAVWEVARVANGWPMWGPDMDEGTLALEANLDRIGAISYEKGCYVGQETVARVHFRGHVNRSLRRVHFAAEHAVPRGAKLFVEGDREIGDVRSSAISSTRGGIAIAMVRRETEDGATTDARWADQTAAVSIGRA
jgi:folate-binding protein YgfZ